MVCKVLDLGSRSNVAWCMVHKEGLGSGLSPILVELKYCKPFRMIASTGRQYCRCHCITGGRLEVDEGESPMCCYTIVKIMPVSQLAVYYESRPSDTQGGSPGVE